MTGILPNTETQTCRRPIYFLLHLPKNAGQTITGHLAEHCPPGTYFEPGRGMITLAPNAVGPLLALSGHWLDRRMEAAFPDREIRRTVLLRDPFGLHLSLYNYRMMNYRAKGLGTYDFAQHLASIPRNYQAFCLLTRWLGFSRAQAMCMSEDRQFSVLDAALQAFWFVGPYLDSDRLLALISADLGVPPVAGRRNESTQWQEIVDWVPVREQSVSESLAGRVARENSVDQALWERWALKENTALPLSRGMLLRAAGAVGTHFAEAHRRWQRDFAGSVRLGQRGLVRVADAARSREDWPAAAKAYRAAIGNLPGTPSLWIELARALRANGDERAALVAFDRAFALKSNMPSIQLERAARQAEACVKPVGI